MKSQAVQHSLRAMSLGVGSVAQWILRLGLTSTLVVRPGNAELTARIGWIHEQSRGTYGAPRVHAEVAAGGRHIGRKRVARLMREKGQRGVSRRKGTATTKKDWAAAVAPDLVKRDFAVDGPDHLWVADITYVPTWAGYNPRRRHSSIGYDSPIQFEERYLGVARDTSLNLSTETG